MQYLCVDNGMTSRWWRHKRPCPTEAIFICFSSYLTKTNANNGHHLNTYGHGTCASLIATVSGSSYTLGDAAYVLGKTSHLRPVGYRFDICSEVEVIWHNRRGGLHSFSNTASFLLEQQPGASSSRKSATAVRGDKRSVCRVGLSSRSVGSVGQELQY